MQAEIVREAEEALLEVDKLLGIPEQLPATHKEKLIKLAKANKEKLLSSDTEMQKFLEFFKEASTLAASNGKKMVAIPYKLQKALYYHNSSSGNPNYKITFFDKKVEICESHDNFLKRIKKILGLAGYKIRIYENVSNDIVISWGEELPENGWRALLPLLTIPILITLNSVFSHYLYSTIATMDHPGRGLLAGVISFCLGIGSIFVCYFWKDSIADEIKYWRNVK